jgi:formylmethanofuran dehydrogenase subunit E
MEILICKCTGKEFQDIANRSGVITEHLKDLNIDVPSSYIRRKYLSENKIFWHLQFFNISKRNEKETFECKYCDWNTVDLDNKSGWYTTHLLNNHNKTVQEYLLEYPSESFKFKTILNKIEQKEETEVEGNYVECKICGEKNRYLTNTHLKKHGITPGEYKIKFGIENYASKNFKNKSRDILKIAALNIKKTYVSKPEKDLKKFISEDLNFEILSNNKSLFNGIEIDITIPDKKICFEFNGNLYHSENYGGKKRFFHLNKTEICQKNGYKLIHIMEDEWFLKNEIVKEKIKHILNFKNENRKSIYARNCQIKLISSKDKNTFLNKNHIQGEDKSDIHLGAFYNEELVSVMTFGSKRNMTSTADGSFELRRFASDINYLVVGVFSKFISFFKKNYNPKHIFTFLDLRWNPNLNDNVYTKNGFSMIELIKPDYTYYNSKISRYKRFHKFSFGKNLLKEKFPQIYSKDKTEWQIMQELGYDRIWDCGKYRYEVKF